MQITFLVDYRIIDSRLFGLYGPIPSPGSIVHFGEGTFSVERVEINYRDDTINVHMREVPEKV